METTYEQAKANRAYNEALWKQACAALDVFPRLPNGLHPDAVKASPEYQRAKREADYRFRVYQLANQRLVKQFKSEMRAERRENGRLSA